jgi:hypothetical protein
MYAFKIPHHRELLKSKLNLMQCLVFSHQHGYNIGSLGYKALSWFSQNLMPQMRQYRRNFFISFSVVIWAEAQNKIGLIPNKPYICHLFQSPNLDMTPIKITVSLTKSALSEIDAKDSKMKMTRSGFLTKAALKYYINLIPKFYIF